MPQPVTIEFEGDSQDAEQAFDDVLDDLRRVEREQQRQSRQSIAEARRDAQDRSALHRAETGELIQQIRRREDLTREERADAIRQARLRLQGTLTALRRQTEAEQEALRERRRDEADSLAATRRNLRRQLQAHQEHIRQRQRLYSDIAGFAGGFGIGIGFDSIIQGARFVGQATSTYARLTDSLEALYGSAELAAGQLALLQDLADQPGITLRGAAQTVISLRSIGIEGQRARNIILELGNALALSGLPESRTPNVIRPIGQITGRGEIQQEEINQLIENAPIFGRVLRETFGTRSAERLRATGIEVDDFINRLIEGASRLERAAPDSFQNILENFGNASESFAARLGGIFLPGFTTILQAGTNLFEEWETRIRILTNIFEDVPGREVAGDIASGTGRFLNDRGLQVAQATSIATITASVVTALEARGNIISRGLTRSGLGTGGGGVAPGIRAVATGIPGIAGGIPSARFITAQGLNALISVLERVSGGLNALTARFPRAAPITLGIAGLATGAATLAEGGFRREQERQQQQQQVALDAEAEREREQALQRSQTALDEARAALEAYNESQRETDERTTLTNTVTRRLRERYNALNGEIRRLTQVSAGYSDIQERIRLNEEALAAQRRGDTAEYQRITALIQERREAQEQLNNLQTERDIVSVELRGVATPAQLQALRTFGTTIATLRTDIGDYATAQQRVQLQESALAAQRSGDIAEYQRLSRVIQRVDASHRQLNEALQQRARLLETLRTQQPQAQQPVVNVADLAEARVEVNRLGREFQEALGGRNEQQIQNAARALINAQRTVLDLEFELTSQNETDKTELRARSIEQYDRFNSRAIQIVQQAENRITEITRQASQARLQTIRDEFTARERLQERFARIAEAITTRVAQAQATASFRRAQLQAQEAPRERVPLEQPPIEPIRVDRGVRAQPPPEREPVSETSRRLPDTIPTVRPLVVIARETVEVQAPEIEQPEQPEQRRPRVPQFQPRFAIPVSETSRQLPEGLPEVRPPRLFRRERIDTQQAEQRTAAARAQATAEFEENRRQIQARNRLRDEETRIARAQADAVFTANRERIREQNRQTLQDQRNEVRDRDRILRINAQNELQAINIRHAEVEERERQHIFRMNNIASSFVGLATDSISELVTNADASFQEIARSFLINSGRIVAQAFIDYQLQKTLDDALTNSKIENLNRLALAQSAAGFTQAAAATATASTAISAANPFLSAAVAIPAIINLLKIGPNEANEISDYQRRLRGERRGR